MPSNITKQCTLAVNQRADVFLKSNYMLVNLTKKTCWLLENEHLTDNKKTALEINDNGREDVIIFDTDWEGGNINSSFFNTTSKLQHATSCKLTFLIRYESLVMPIFI